MSHDALRALQDSLGDSDRRGLVSESNIMQLLDFSQNPRFRPHMLTISTQDSPISSALTPLVSELFMSVS